MLASKVRSRKLIHFAGHFKHLTINKSTVSKNLIKNLKRDPLQATVAPQSKTDRQAPPPINPVAELGGVLDWERCCLSRSQTTPRAALLSSLTRIFLRLAAIVLAAGARGHSILEHPIENLFELTEFGFLKTAEN